MLEQLKENWHLLLAAAAFAVWLIRLEAAMKENRQDILRLWKARDEDKKAADELRIESNDILHEVRHDIKNILQGMGELRGKSK